MPQSVKEHKLERNLQLIMKMASIENCIDILTEVKVCADEVRREQLGSSYPIDVINIVETAKILQKAIAQNCVWHQKTTGR